MADDLTNLYNPVPTPVDLGETPAPINTGRFDPNFVSNVANPLITGQQQANLPIGSDTSSYDEFAKSNVHGAAGANKKAVKTIIPTDSRLNKKEFNEKDLNFWERMMT